MNKKQTTFSLKDQLFNKHKVEYLAGLLKDVHLDFDDKNFITEVVNKFPELELKQRVSHISDMLKKYLPDDYEESLNILLKSLPEVIENGKMDNNFGDFIFCPYGEFVAQNGCKKQYLDISLNALDEMTSRFSAEDSIRYFLNSFEKETFTKMLLWSKSEDYHHRRLSSEGTRAKLPWCQKINLDYRKTIQILDNLYFDESRYVTRSVANHLNDISKIDSSFVVNTLKKWKKSKKGKDIDYIISHSTRGLVKAGDKETLNFLGYHHDPQIEVRNFNLSNEVKIGKSLEFHFDIIPKKEESLIIDYKIHFIGKNNKLLPKVFKIKKLKLKKSEKIAKKHQLKLMTTKALYEGKHFLEIIINGKSFGKKNFELKS